jgi:cytochrome c biogenesis protein CcmG, thiol:disulfide interchange protein DsbE
MVFRIILVAGFACSAVLLRAAEEKFRTLQIGSEVYTNVTVTSVTPTDIYFTHSRGMGNAKLKKLDPELQRKFNFDADKAAAKETEQTEAHVLYREWLSTQLASREPRTADEPDDSDSAAEEPQARSAKSFINQPMPVLAIEKWLTPEPELTGKFALIDFWATWCAPCRRSIPELNALHRKFSDRLVIIGLSDESQEIVQKMTSPQIEYAVAIDRQARTARTIRLAAIPYALLVDPKGIVRFEGHPSSLDERTLESMLARFSE